MNKMQHKLTWQTPNWLRVLCLTLLVCTIGTGAYAQCNNTAAFGSGTAPTTAGTPVTLTTCAYFGEYSTINSVQAATIYSCNVTPSGYLTIREGTPGGAVIAHGASPLTWNSTVAGTYYVHYNADPACGTNTSCHTGTVSYISPASGCSGTVAAGTSLANGVATTNGGCPATAMAFTLSGATVGTGLTYQWEYSATSGGPYAPIAGATNGSYSVASFSASNVGFYQCVVTCTASSSTATSTPVEATLNSFLNCYCTPTNAGGACLTNVSFHTLNNTTTGCTGTNNYNYYPTPVTQVSQAATYTFSITTDQAAIASVWFDWDQSGTFTASEWTQVFTNATSGTLSVLVPLTALTGQTRMRVRTRLSGNQNGAGDACLNMGSGETEDYVIDILAATPCAGTPNPGNTLASQNPVCPNTNVTLSLQNQPTTTGNTYQWYNGAGAIPGATDMTYTVSNFTIADDYYCDVTCTNSSTTTSSNLINLTLNNFLNCYCLPNSNFGTSTGFYGVVSNVTLNSINNTSTYPATSPYYTNYPSGPGTSTSVVSGSPYPFSVTVGGYTQAAAWFDWNQNGSFADAGEFIFLGNNATASPVTYSTTLTVPVLVAPAGGLTKMRVRSEAYFYPNLTDAQSCGNTNYGESEDYELDIIIPVACSGAPAPGATIASASAVCPGTTVTFSLSNTNMGTGITYQWVNNSGPIAGATNAFYSQLITTPDDVYCDVTCNNAGGSTTASGLASIAVNGFLNCYCIPSSTNGTSSAFYGSLTNVTINTINNTSTNPTTSPYFTNYAPGAGTTTQLVAGNAYPLNTTVGTYTQLGVWFDWDQNGTFDSLEYTFIGNNTTATTPVNYTTIIPVPLTATGGLTKMRVRTRAYFEAAFTGADACLLTSYGESEEYVIDIQIPVICSGAPAPGMTTANASSVCPGGTVNLGLTNGNNGTGVTYEWYENGVAIAGATNSYYTATVTAAASYYCAVTCTNPGGSTTNSGAISISLNPFLDCYCASAPTNTADEEIYQVTVNGATTDPLYANANGCATAAPGPGSVLSRYSNFKTLGSFTNLPQGAPIAFEIRQNECDAGTLYNNGIGVWIDFNQNGSFADAGEAVYIEAATSAATGASPGGDKVITGSFVVPAGATLGSTAMRIICAESNAGANLTPCLQYGYGETEDFLVTVVTNPNCTGTPTPGNTIASATSVCPNGTVLLTLQNATPGSAVEYQWYNGAGAIAGATNFSYTATMTTPETFYCIVTCTASTQSGTSTSVAVGINSFLDCYCASTPTQTADEEIYQVTVNGASTNPLYANANGCTTAAPGPGSILSRYSNFKTLGTLTSVQQGATTTFEVRQNECDGATFYGAGIGVWIDYNHNGSFTDPGEAVFVEATTSAATGASPGGDKVVSGSFTIPMTAMTGQTAMRVICAEGYSATSFTPLTPCLAYGYGETEDYLIDITVNVPCAGTPTPGNTIASATAVCAGTAVNFSLQNATTGSGVTYQWYEGATPIAGATNSIYTATITAAGSYYCEVTCSAGPSTGSSTPVSITLNSATSCYCAASATTNGCVTGDEYIDEVTFNTISNASACSAGAQYTDFTSISTTVNQGNTYTITVNNANYFTSDQASAWIDFNQDGLLDDATEQYVLTGGSATSPFSGAITIPMTATLGSTRLRVRLNWSGAMSSCGATTYGEVEDYTIVVGPPVTNTTLNLTMFIEGYWDGTSAMQPVLANQGQGNPATDCDSVTVELHDENAPYGVLHTTTAVLQTNGTAACVFTTPVTPGNYYIAVKHRNAIQTWSAAPVAISAVSSYNFSSAATQAYGTGAQVEVATGVWAFFSGDVVIDDNMDLLDLGAVETDANLFLFGYYATDLTGDGNVDLLDTPIVEVNAGNFIFSQHP